ncbi:MAG: hypothetical protein LKE50_04215 [Atopobiaceae bacterium]|jgi:hypothetical protein|nr:hypothetical protein [Atopobiaceae bacterium]
MASVGDIARAIVVIAAGISSADDQKMLYEARDSLFKLQDENRELREKADELSTKLRRREELKRDGSSYYLVEDDGSRFGPICPSCYEDSGIVISLARGNGEARCSVCGKKYSGVVGSVPGRQTHIG